MKRYSRVIVGALGLFGVNACAVEQEPWFIGVWHVTEAEFPGMSAMGREEAEAWFGRELYYSHDEVSFKTERCYEPVYSIASLTVDDFYDVYRATFEQLNIVGPEAQILHVGCPEQWTAPGSTLIKVDETSGYMLWDGVFFRVEKAAD